MGLKVSVVDPVVTLKLAALVAELAAFVTETTPVVVPFGTVARTCVLETTVKIEATVPLKETMVTPVKLEPLIVTSVPIDPLVGVNEVMDGGRITVKFVLLLPVPRPLVTLIVPVVAPTGTVAAICVSEFIAKVAAVPLNATFVAAAKLPPVNVTLLPMIPLVGVNAVIDGGPVTVKLLELLPVAAELVTLIVPVLAPLGTLARICVAESTTKPGAATPLNATCVMLLKLLPVIVTGVPTGPLLGLKDVIDGPKITV